MRKYFDTIIDPRGEPVQNAEVRVTDGAGNPVQLYSDNAGAQLSQPVLTTTLGYYEFYIANGNYTLDMRYPASPTRLISGIQIYDDGVQQSTIDQLVSDVANLKTGLPMIPGATAVIVGARSGMAAIVGQADGTPVYLTEPGREGTFVWRLGDYSAQVAADTNQDFYVEADAVSANTGAWVRSYDSGQFLASPTGASLVGQIAAGTGATSRTVQAKLRETVSVTDFGAKGDGATDDTAAFNLAVATGKRVHVPAGTYRTNLVVNNKTVITGEGSTVSILKAADTAKAIIRYTFTAAQSPIFAYWTYHASVSNIGFQSTGKVGIGFTFAREAPADYEENDEFANNVSFYNCRFDGFEKAVQFPFGNIGSSFYDCGITGNKYGIYSLNAKFGGTMHAGNKYFFAGEMSTNDCAIYVHNGSQDGFGAIVLNGTILEQNKIAAYVYSGRTIVPIKFDGAWFEANGSYHGGSTTIDAWDGETRSDQALVNKAVILDGPDALGTMQAVFDDSFFGDVRLKGKNIKVTANNCRSEGQVAFGGGPLLVDYPDTSSITLVNPHSAGGWALGTGYVPLITGLATCEATVAEANRAVARAMRVPPRSSKVTGYGASLAMSAALSTAATTGNGSFDLTGSVVSDGRIYGSCNEFTRTAFATSEFTRLNSPNSLITTVAGWYVFTLDLKCVSGAGVRFSVWNRSGAQLVTNVLCAGIGRWQTFAGIAYSVADNSLYLDFIGNGGDVTWRASAYQIHRFDTQEEASLFLASGVFAVGS